MNRLIYLALSVILLVAGCSIQPKGGSDVTYTQISQETAKEMMAKEDGHVVVDVRRQEEYDAGHIPGAILISNESIGDVRPEALPDPGQIILVYCRSGNRSKQAAQKLADMGYVNVYEFGGINDWTGDVVTGGAKAELSFDSFDGGGPEYRVVLEDPSVVSCESARRYHKPDHEELDGAGYDVVITFTGLKAGETAMTVEERSPIGDNCDRQYIVRVDGELNVSLEERGVIDPDSIVEATAALAIGAEKRIFYATLEDNVSAAALVEKLNSGPIEVEMQDYGGFEKVGPLPWSLPTSDETITTEPGDVILYQGNRITVYYDQNTWEFTRLAKIGNVTREELLEAFGSGDVTLGFWLEWSE